MKDSILQYWEMFKQQNEQYQSFNIPRVDSFCNDKFNTDRCAMLVNERVKTATCSAHILYEIDNDPLPEVGNLTIITNWEGEPVCIIKTTKVYTQKFCVVDEEWAKKEGEGDLSLAWWKEAHQRFFTKLFADYNIIFDEEMLLVCEEFERI
jgi:uncharacterized protein YhfF